MNVVEVFSRRQREQRGEVSDVFTYDEVPHALRIQFLHIINDGLGFEDEANRTNQVEQGYQAIVHTLRREHGWLELPPNARGYRSRMQELREFIVHASEAEHILDAVELAARVMNGPARKFAYRNSQSAVKAIDGLLEELNERFRQHGLGYRFDVASSSLVRIDSEFLHAEAVKPALSILSNPKYAGVQDEFLKAHEHYRHGRSKEAMSEALKSLESMAKSIARSHEWPYDERATMKPLLDVLFERELIPKLWTQQFTGLRTMLESGVPTARNRLAGHGQGTEIVDVPDHFVSFALHQTASALVFLDAAERAFSSPT
jgi:hypothetical protein